jgi:DNA invertase Pin-like site-specific DNA recombinase
MGRAKFTSPAEVVAVGYVRVSTDEQGASGAGLEAQREAIRTDCRRRGWRLQLIHEDVGLSGKGMIGRAGLQHALDEVRTSEASVLVVAKLDRLSRSLADAAGILARADKEGWKFVALDLGVDTSTPSGALVAQVMASFAEYERKLIGQRTRDALAVKKSQGIRLGRPGKVSPDIVKRIRKAKARGLSYAAVAEELNGDNVARPGRGIRWYPSTVRDAALRADPTAHRGR